MQSESNTKFDTTKWSDLLKEAVNKPGVISEAYRAFHGYSIGNQMLAMIQCRMRGLTPGPISTYPGWRAKGRQVRKGEKAITLCMPLTCKRKGESSNDQGGSDDDAVFTRFVFKPHWFTLSQTDGEPIEAPVIPDWNREQALAALGVSEIPFDHVDGNTLGYARGMQIAISPVNPM